MVPTARSNCCVLMLSKHRILLVYLLMLTPLLYGQDGDNYRAWEVAAVAVLVFSCATYVPVRPMRSTLAAILATYCILLVVQQFVIQHGNFFFGVKYAVAMTTVFIPAFVIQSVRWEPADFPVLWDRAMRVLAVLFIVNFFGSRILGLGQVDVGMQGTRAFGLLGDSFSPIPIFPLLYFFFRREYLWSLAMLGALLLTGGKAALVMLFATFVLYSLLKGSWSVRLVTAAVVIVVIGVGAPVLLKMAESIPVLAFSINTRLISFEMAWGFFTSSPLVGIGINQSMADAAGHGIEIAKLANLSFYYSVYQVDNAFLRTLAETGLIGLAILLAFCVVLLCRAFASLAIANRIPDPATRALVIAGGLWTITFIILYQFVGWFEAGHPQMTWLLLISSVSYAASERFLGSPVSPKWKKGQAVSAAPWGGVMGDLT